jgi:hypothetical protein
VPVLTGLLVGLMFLGAAYVMHPRPRPGDVRTHGTVVEAWLDWSGGERSWSSRVEFCDGAGRAWVFEPELSGPREPVRGSQVSLVYDPADPLGTARQTDGLIRWYVWGAVAMGVVAIVSGLFLSPT